MQPAIQLSRRIEWIDAIRGIALLAMVSYHFTWDLEFFNYVTPGLTAFGGWKIYARCIASSFLFLVGVSLVLAHGNGIRWQGFGKRLAMIVAAASAITLATWFATPHSFIFFGILHHIALASVLGLAFLRFRAWALVLAALVVAGAPHYLRQPLFDHPALWWVGLSLMPPRSNDYVPLFPWFAAVLAGMAATRFAQSFGLLARLGGKFTRMPGRLLVKIGQHSLAFYLLHQPVLIAGLWLFALIWPAPAPDPATGFAHACEHSCLESRDQIFCTTYCTCMFNALQDEGALDNVMRGAQTARQSSRLGELASICTLETDMKVMGEEE
ncbi:heparan-alpha-glucosaminide N-acetyltransferase [Aquamicrobium segne]|uniref:Heparan-alpha-glucosaminide N-acetyltransferase n=1 Tax=Aquamicrobium segne TaxID=469547 RepID=A0ABW0GXQ0_9HYPH